MLFENFVFSPRPEVLVRGLLPQTQKRPIPSAYPVDRPSTCLVFYPQLQPKHLLIETHRQLESRNPQVRLKKPADESGRCLVVLHANGECRLTRQSSA